MKEEADLLYGLVMKYLNDLDRVHSEHDLVYEVVGDYIYHLNTTGHTPNQHLDDIEDLIRDEVLEIYRKKTYGFSSLVEYRKSTAGNCH